MTDIPIKAPTAEEIFQSKIADAFIGTGWNPERLCEQLEAWPRQLDPSKPTNVEYLTGSAAAVLRDLLAFKVPDDIVAPYRPPTGDFMCHNCKTVHRDLIVAPRRCGECGCRDFAAQAPVRRT